MRPVRFVALSEDGQAFVLADEVGRLLALPIDERVHTAIRTEPGHPAASPPMSAGDAAVALSPRDIQARIRAGESADEVARVAGVPVDRVLRYAGPVLQERAMLAQHARRTRLKSSEKGSSLAEVVDGRLAQHGVDAEKISWDAYRRDDGTWRIVATWPSGKATAQAIWDLDKTRQVVTPHDDMAQYLCTERPAPILGQEPLLERPGRSLGAPSRGEKQPGRPGPGRPGSGRARTDPPGGRHGAARAAAGAGTGPGLDPRPDPVGPRRAARLARPSTRTLRRTGRAGRGVAPRRATRQRLRRRRRRAQGGAGGYRPSRCCARAVRAPAPVPAATRGTGGDKPRKRLPSWDDVLFGSAPARESS